MSAHTPKTTYDAPGPRAPVGSAAKPAATGRLDEKLPDVLGQELTNIIERRIIFLDFEPGAHLTEQEISKEFSISRSPVREAFRQLEASGLVVRLARRGVRVKEMTEQNLNEIYSCRVPLEGMAAAAAAKHASKDDLDRMKGALEGMATALEISDVNRFFDENIAFQKHMHEACGNLMLQRILADLDKHAFRYRYFGHTKAAEIPQFSYEAQLAVFAAIERRNTQEAKKLTMRMIRQAKRLHRKVLRQHGHELSSGA